MITQLFDHQQIMKYFDIRLMLWEGVDWPNLDYPIDNLTYFDLLTDTL